MKTIGTIFLSLLLFASPVFADGASQPIEAFDAIQLAAAAAPEVVPGTFSLTIQATGTDKHALYLNSEADYRDQRCLTIEIPKAAIPALQAKFGKDLEDYFQGKHLLVSGAAERVTVYFVLHHRVTKTYYYQTHILVESPEQLTVMAQ
jgi:hypothetical protein